MKTANLLCYILLLLACNKKEKRWNAPFGEGSLTIRQYFIPNTDTVEMDTTSRLFMEMTYYIKGNKIRRLDKETRHLFFSEKKTTTSRDGTVSSFLEARLEHPSYLIYWDSLIVYTFFRQKGNILASRDSLPQQTAEIFIEAT